jgi:hypothetical protein
MSEIDAFIYCCFFFCHCTKDLIELCSNPTITNDNNNISINDNSNINDNNDVDRNYHSL